MKPEYQRFLLTELVALIQFRYKLEFFPIIYENKREYVIIKPSRFDLHIYSPEQAPIYNVVFVLEFLYFKITRKYY